MKKIVLIIILFCTINTASAILNWPVAKPVFTSHFGESRYDHWHNGIDITSGNKYELSSPANGEVIFYNDETDTPMPDNFGSGNFIVIEHDKKIRTFHCHLKAGTIIKNKVKLTSEDIYAHIGNSGRSSGPHLHMSLISSKDNRILNPIDFFPRVEDKKKPVIKKILLKGPMSDAVNIMKVKRIRRKSYYRVIVAAMDYREGPKYLRAPVSPRSIELYIDNKLTKKISLNYISLKNNHYCINGNPDGTFQRTYAGRPYYIDLAGFVISKNKHVFKVIVKDNGGNVTKKSVTITFY